MLGYSIPAPQSISLPCSTPTNSKHFRKSFFIFNSVSDRCSSKHQSYTSSTSFKQCEFIDLHKELVPYDKAWALQGAIVKGKKELIGRNEECPDTVIILQHSSVYTLGTGSSEEYLNFDKSNAPFDIFRTERGGEVTYHGPGQLVMYPIMNLRNHKMDLHWYLRALEEVVIRALSSMFSINASRLEGFTGVWVGDKKLAAIGIRVSQWIAYHGLALNVTVDLSPFQKIVPCGIRGRGVGSIKGMLGNLQTSNDHICKDLLQEDDSHLMDLAYLSLVQGFSEVFGVELIKKSFSLSDMFEGRVPLTFDTELVIRP